MTELNRRDLLQAGVALGLSTGIASPTWAAKKDKKIGVALVGLGYYSRDLLAPALQLTQHCELRGIVTGSPEKIPVWQKKYGIKDKNVYNYENMHTVADSPDIDVIYIVLPTFLHMKYSVIAANAGKHVWCEKPMAMTVAECEQIMDACNKNKVQLTIGYRMHHEPNTQTVMSYAKSLPYGKITDVLAQAGYRGSGGPQSDWRMQRSQGGGALYDMGVYTINAARYATGMEPIAVVKAKHIIDRPDLFIHADETTEFTLEFPNKVMADCATSVGRSYNQLKINADKGWYKLEPMQSYTGVKGITSDGKKLDKTITNQQARQMDNDALAILHNRSVMVPGIEGLKDINIVNAILKSAEQGKRIAL